MYMTLIGFVGGQGKNLRQLDDVWDFRSYYLLWYLCRFADSGAFADSVLLQIYKHLLLVASSNTHTF